MFARTRYTNNRTRYTHHRHGSIFGDKGGINKVPSWKKGYRYEVNAEEERISVIQDDVVVHQFELGDLKKVNTL